MKKLLTSVFICAGAFLLTACSGPMNNKVDRQNSLNCQFTSKMTVDLDKLCAEGTMTRLGEGCWEAEFDSPNTLSGVKLRFEENNVNASYKGLEFSVPKSAIPVKAMLTNLISAVDSAAAEDELHGIEKDGIFCIEGSLEGGEYTMTLDDNGYLDSFEMPNNKLKISFSDMQTSQLTEMPTE